jgi:hypothetical protein
VGWGTQQPPEEGEVRAHNHFQSQSFYGLPIKKKRYRVSLPRLPGYVLKNTLVMLQFLLGIEPRL